MNHYLATVAMLACSNVFMTFAWYGHLKGMSARPWLLAALVSWGIALFEYLLQVPANRIGHQVMTVGQLKILQEVITLSIFVPFEEFAMLPISGRCLTEIGLQPTPQQAQIRPGERQRLENDAIYRIQRQG